MQEWNDWGRRGDCCNSDDGKRLCYQSDDNVPNDDSVYDGVITSVSGISARVLRYGGNAFVRCKPNHGWLEDNKVDDGCKPCPPGFELDQNNCIPPFSDVQEQYMHFHEYSGVYGAGGLAILPHDASALYPKEWRIAEFQFVGWGNVDRIPATTACSIRVCVPCQKNRVSVADAGSMYYGTGCQACRSSGSGRFRGHIKLSQQNCGWCPAGQYINFEDGIDYARCDNCEPGKYKSESMRENDDPCTQCAIGTISSVAATACSKCRANTQPNQAQSTCVACPAGYDKTMAFDVCQRCPSGFYSKGEEDDCEQCNGILNSAQTECDLCIGWDRALGKNPFACDVVRRRSIVSGSAANGPLLVLAVDEMKEGTNALLPIFEVERGYYLLNPEEKDKQPVTVNCHDRCAKNTNADEYPALCGSYATATNVYVQLKNYQDAVWNPVRDLLDIKLTHTVFLMQEIDFAFSNIANTDWNLVAANLDIMRSGKCLKCRQCNVGEFNKYCNEISTWDDHTPPGSGSCYSCYGSAGINSCRTGYWSHPHAFNCTPSAVYIPTTGYQCTQCEHFQSVAGQYRLVVGCGPQTTLARWHPRAEVDFNSRLLKTVLCTYANSQPCTFDTAQYDACENCYYEGELLAGGDYYTAQTQTMPYCPPGWYVNATCVDESVSYNVECCARCTVCPLSEVTVGVCDGTSHADVTCRTGCEPGQFLAQHSQSSVECQNCTICGTAQKNFDFDV